MYEQLVPYIVEYGYLAILCLIFLQEVGLPSPLPNEFILIFSGFMASTGVLKAPFVLLSAIAGDLLASTLIYVLFYFFGKFIVRFKPRWLRIPDKRIKRLATKLNNSENPAIFIGRLTPFVKGYVSVFSGLLRVSPHRYTIIMFFTSIIWVIFYVSIGYVAGPYWDGIFRSYEIQLYAGLTIALLLALIISFFRVWKKKTSSYYCQIKFNPIIK